MKKLLVATIFGIVGMVAQASYLSWQVTSTDFTGEPFNYAALYARNTDGTSTVNLSGLVQMPGAQSTNITNYQSDNWQFFIELFNYQDSSFKAVAESEIFCYSDIAETSALSDSLLNSAQAMANAMSGTPYHAVPEPTTGLLTLLGVALLGLKRRKVA